VKTIGTCMCVKTACPFLRPGLNFHLLTACTAGRLELALGGVDRGRVADVAVRVDDEVDKDLAGDPGAPHLKGEGRARLEFRDGRLVELRDVEDLDALPRPERVSGILTMFFEIADRSGGGGSICCTKESAVTTWGTSFCIGGAMSCWHGRLVLDDLRLVRLDLGHRDLDHRRPSP
jgi:hypothetical protein